MAATSEQSGPSAAAGDEHLSTSEVPASTTAHRNDDGLPRSFDVLIVGTGLTESIVSAAASRNGHSVLHLDPREYYGGSWATFSFDQWSSGSFMEAPSEATEAEICLGDTEGKLRWKNNVRGLEQVWYTNCEETKSELNTQKRRFNIDLMPKLLAAREDIIQLLITSNVSRYLEFLRVAKLMTTLPSPKENVIESIPLSRADIFTSKSLTLVEKRSLVKLIEAVLQPQKSVEDADDEAVEESQGAASGPVTETFQDLVKKIKVPKKLEHMVKSSVTTLEDGFSPDDERLNQEFCSRCRLLLSSIGRYGNQTPFLWTLYGISEICQAFCRLSAVYGGIFILKRHVSKIKASDEGFVVQTEQDEITAKHVILGPDTQCDLIGKDKSKKEQAAITLGRAVLVTNGGNIKLPDENAKQKGDGIYVYRISGFEVIEMNHNSQAVPKNYRLVQISFPILDAETNALQCRTIVEKHLSEFLEFNPPSSTNDSAAEASATASEETCSEIPRAQDAETKNTSKPQVIYGSYFLLHYTCDSIFSELFRNDVEKSSKGLILECGIASTELSEYVSKAKEIFSVLYPDEEFLPRAPDCEEPETMNGDYDDYVADPLAGDDDARDQDNADEDAEANAGSAEDNSNQQDADGR